ncbi:MAG: acyl-CoA thioesterase [Pseudomonadota bacterium]
MLLELIKTLLRHRRPATHGPLDAVRKAYRVGLRHIDFNLHINNAVYLNFLEKARWDHGVQTGLAGPMVRERINFIVAAIDIGYIRELRLGTRFEVSTRIVGWDEKYVYIDQRCLIGNKVHATAMLRAAYVQNGKVLPPQQVFDKLPDPVPVPALPEPFEQWKALAQSKRQYNEAHPDG